MKNLKAPKLVTIGILSTITIVFWIAFEIFRIFTVKPPPDIPAAILNPINPTLDSSALNKLQQRLFLTDEQIGNIIVTPPSPQPSPIEEASPSAEPEATGSGEEVATESGGIE